MLARLQRGLEAMYRVDTQLEVEDFVIDAETRGRMGLARAPREQLIVCQAEGELDLGLFVDEGALANLAQNDPTDGLHGDNLDDFCLTLEGVSHFVYLVWRAQARLPVSALELELQAEVDKFVTCALTMEQTGQDPGDLPSRLFRDVEFADDLDADERTRYRVANENALRYGESLQRRFVNTRRLHALLGEVRRFYRLPLDGKLDWIREAA